MLTLLIYTWWCYRYVVSIIGALEGTLMIPTDVLRLLIARLERKVYAIIIIDLLFIFYFLFLHFNTKVHHKLFVLRVYVIFICLHKINLIIDVNYIQYFGTQEETILCGVFSIMWCRLTRRWKSLTWPEFLRPRQKVKFRYEPVLSNGFGWE